MTQWESFSRMSFCLGQSATFSVPRDSIPHGVAAVLEMLSPSLVSSAETALDEALHLLGVLLQWRLLVWGSPAGLPKLPQKASCGSGGQSQLQRWCACCKLVPSHL